jgi:UDP-N-acetylglucosamine acyltransferase
MLSPLAQIDPGARLGKRVRVGPFAVVAADVEIGDRSQLGPGAVLCSGTRIGPDCRIGPGSIVGGPPADSHFHGETSRVIIGRGNVLREYVTIHRASGQDRATVLGDNNLVMAYVHIAHNCHIGSHVTLTNACQLGGHVEVHDHAVVGGLTGIHQFTRVGTHAMVGACSYLTQDLPPFLLGAGNPFRVLGLNAVGLRRAGFSSSRLAALRRLYRIVYRSRLTLTAAVRELPRVLPDSRDRRVFLEFVMGSRRGLRLKSPD